MVVLKVVLAILLALASLSVHGPEPALKGEPLSQIRCLVSAVYHEARGEPVAGQRAVLDTIYHRMERTSSTACQVVAKRQQFPWYKKKGLVPLTEDNVSLYNRAKNHPRVLTDSRFVYFNGIQPHGTGCKKIGGHIFCKEQ